MILKKPYGLMIKHFRLIHLILAVLTAYIMYSSRTIVGFFQDYVANDFKANVLDNMASIYIDSLIYFAIIVVIGALIALLILLMYKEKPYKFYLYAIIYYILLFVGIIFSANLLNGLSDALWEASASLIYRDVSMIIYLPQIFFIVFLVIRTLGFDVKKFDFKKDIAEMDLSDADSEEVEINFGFETYKAKRNIRRFIRETGYYIRENLMIVIAIGTTIGVILIWTFIKNFEIFNNNYRIGKFFAFGNFSLRIDDALVTNLDYKGEVISDDYYYLVIKATFTNNSKDSLPIDYSKLLIYKGNLYYEPQLNLGNNFIDYGEPYFGKEIPSNDTKTVLLSYQIPKKDSDRKFKLIIYKGSSLKKKTYKAKTSTVTLTPLILDSVDIVSSININTPIYLNDTYLDNTEFNIKSMTITDKYTYQYESCISGFCNNYNDNIIPKYKGSNKNALLVLDYDYNLDNDSEYAKNYQNVTSFANNFFKIRYLIGTKEYYADVECVNKSNLKDKLVLETTSEVNQANKIDLVITIRNKRYIINMK